MMSPLEPLNISGLWNFFAPGGNRMTNHNVDDFRRSSLRITLVPCVRFWNRMARWLRQLKFVQTVFTPFGAGSSVRRRIAHTEYSIGWLKKRKRLNDLVQYHVCWIQWCTQQLCLGYHRWWLIVGVQHRSIGQVTRRPLIESRRRNFCVGAMCSSR